MKKSSSKGIVLISILMVTVVLLMVASSLLVLNYYNLGFTNMSENKVSALKIAEAGVAYAIYNLKENPAWEPNVPVVYHMKGVPGRFEITFDRTKPYYSVNNLKNDATDPGVLPGWGGKGVPGHSVDLIITAYAGNEKDSKAVKHIRAILQRDIYYPGSFSSGQTTVDANTADIRTEATTENPGIAGNIHSNSVKATSSVYAIDTKNSKVLLHGGKASAQGDVKISDLDADSTTAPFSPGKNVTPLDLNKIISNGIKNVSSNLAGGTYVINKDDVKGPSTLPASCEVKKGKLYIKEDLAFTGNVKFELNDKSKDAGIYLEKDKNGNAPSLYVDQGNLKIAGPLQGSGSCYVSGKTALIGETNIVASDDTGVAVLSKGDVSMELPSSKKQALDQSITGLVYSHGNINIKILDPNSDVNPANNSSATPWPGDWEDSSGGSGGSGASVYDILEDNYPYAGTIEDTTLDGANGSTLRILDRSGGSVNLTTSGGSYKFEPTNASDFHMTLIYTDENGNATTWTCDMSSTPSYITVDTNSNVIDTNCTVNILSFTPAPGSSTPTPDPSGGTTPGTGNTGPGTTPTPSTAGDKIPPNFTFTGGLVAVDPNNPVPSTSNPDTDTAGNIKVSIGQGHVSIISSPKYLKLLDFSESSNVNFRCIYWSEI
ncbi:MAG: hypothetical protein ABRQ39_05355 [Candidatus Eremiobacterota bacterium]